MGYLLSSHCAQTTHEIQDSPNAKWTNVTIARIMPLHACPARCGARRRGETAKLGSASCLPSIASKLLSRHPPRVSPSQPQRARPPANGTHSSTKSSRKPPLRQSRSVGRYPSLKASSHRLNADSRRRRQRGIIGRRRIVFAVVGLVLDRLLARF